MEVWLWVTIGILTLIVVALAIKLHLFKKGTNDIENAFAEKFATGTNTLIDVSCNDRHMRKLANAINAQLRKLRSERQRFQQGNTELKNAITNISHDLRTPLTSICGYLDLLEQEEKSEAVERYIKIIKNRSEMLKQLTEELFRYSILISVDGGKEKENVVINSVLEESIAAFYSDLRQRKIVPKIQMPKCKVVRNIERSALSRVFSNVLNNAIKYSDGDLNIILNETGKIEFTNTATGLNKVQVGRLFQRFYTVETARKSTGLGLAIARTLVEQMGGEITAEYDDSRLTISILFSHE